MKPLIAAAVAALALPATAPAHVTVDPREAPAGGFATLDVRVPNEHADKSTVKVDLRLPDGVYFLWYRKVPGWKVKLTRKPLDTPIDFGGVPVSEHITRIVWTGKRKRGGTIGPDKYEEFPLYMRIPDGKPGDQLAFPAIQTYGDGSREAWTGGPGSDHPASRLTLTAADEG
jgi:periplasmic copper chaperone A